MCDNTFYKKGYGRIFVYDKEKILDVIEIIKEVDGFEYEYLRKDFVTFWTGKIDLIYSGKFEINIKDLTKACWNKGIYIWCVTKRDET